jgi:ribosomal protein L7/L12
MDPIIQYAILFLVCLLALQSVAIWFAVARVGQQLARIVAHLGIDTSKPLPLSDRVKELARQPSRKIEAIKLLREETGMSLSEAKTAIDEYIRSMES